MRPVQQQLLERLRCGIWAGRYGHGERLPEARLAGEFGVGRGPLRDVLVRLTREGLLEARPNAGVSVAREPSAFQRATLVRVRRTLECRALRHVPRGERAVLTQALGGNLRRYKPACRGERLEDVVRLDMAFHRAIVAAADGGSLIPAWLPIVSQMFLRYSRHTSLTESYEEHAAIVEALRSGDHARAVAALRSHIV